jgi:EAL domain-containing protein (putative c-di-GMP-specific phosphodiesterase class I)/GGDEF domain-containing protein
LRALKLGATDFLSKPVDASELVLRVRNTLAFRQYHNRMINFDATTGLPNQRLFDRGIDEMVARQDLVGGLVALFSIAVPECRQIQESMDQATADNLTKVLARRLDRFANAANPASAISTSTERAPRVARLGSDHFGVVLEGLANAEEVEMAARRMVAVLSEPVVLGFHEVGPTPWIGISLAPADGHIASVLRQGADLAASSARQLGGTNFMFVSPDLNERSLHKMTLGSQLRGAVQRGELRLHYQPKVDVTTNRIIGAESLVRWLHPEHGLLPPGRFIPLAEDLGLIGPIGQWVIEQACLDAANWVRAGLGNLKVAVNVAKPQFASGDLCSTVRYNVATSGLPARLLVMELTESMLMDDVEAAQKLMADLKSLGVTLSIDDFGTGFSSLSYLKSFPLDELKIDRSFIADLPGVKSDVAIVRTIIDLGHRLGMSVIAEGIETAGQLACIRQLGCDNYQGFLFSKPLPAAEFVALVAQENARHGPLGASAEAAFKP